MKIKTEKQKRRELRFAAGFTGFWVGVCLTVLVAVLAWPEKPNCHWQHKYPLVGDAPKKPFPFISWMKNDDGNIEYGYWKEPENNLVWVAIGEDTHISSVTITPTRFFDPDGGKR